MLDRDNALHLYSLVGMVLASFTPFLKVVYGVF